MLFIRLGESPPPVLCFWGQISVPLTSLIPGFGYVSMPFPFVRSCFDVGLSLSPPSRFQVKASLDVLVQKIATFTDVGNSLAHAEHLLKDLTSFEEKSSVRTGTWTDAGGRQPSEEVPRVVTKVA